MNVGCPAQCLIQSRDNWAIVAGCGRPRGHGERHRAWYREGFPCPGKVQTVDWGDEHYPSRWDTPAPAADVVNEHLDDVVAAGVEYVNVAGTDREMTQRAIVHERVQRWLDAMADG